MTRAYQVKEHLTSFFRSSYLSYTVEFQSKCSNQNTHAHTSFHSKILTKKDRYILDSNLFINHTI